MCQKLWKSDDSRQSYCKNYLASFLAHPVCTVRTWNNLKTALFLFTVQNLLSPRISSHLPPIKVFEFGWFDNVSTDFGHISTAQNVPEFPETLISELSAKIMIAPLWFSDPSFYNSGIFRSSEYVFHYLCTDMPDIRQISISDLDELFCLKTRFTCCPETR